MVSTLRNNAYKLLEEKRTLLAHLTETEKAYLAGLIDGEGTIGLFNRERTNVQVCIPYVAVSNTNTLMRDWLKERIPFGGWGNPGRSASRDNRWKLCYSVLWSSMSGIAILEAVMPYLVLKKKNAQWVLGYWRSERGVLHEAERTRFSRTFGKPSWLIFQRDAAGRALTRLNQRGAQACQAGR